MSVEIFLPVRAVNDIYGGSSAVIVKQGTRGEIIGLNGDAYTATFWPFGPDSVQVTIGNLSGTDFLAA
jgi:hypothetical protein